MEPQPDSSVWETSDAALPPGFVSARVQRLLKKASLAPGHRVLVAGCANVRLLRSLVWLGLDVTGIDESEEAVALAALQVPEARFEIGLIPRSQFQDRSRFWDLIIAGDQSVWSLNLLHEPAFLQTVDLLTCLRPGGMLGFNDSDSIMRHESRCYTQHFQALAATVQSQELDCLLSVDDENLLIRNLSGDTQTREFDILARYATRLSATSCCQPIQGTPVIPS